MAKRINKYLYLWIVQGYYPYGKWEDIYIGEDKKDARLRLKEYRINESMYSHRMIYRRELNPEYTETKG